MMEKMDVPEVPGEEDSAAEIYAAGKRLCEIAESMGYSPEEESEEEETQLEDDQRIPAQAHGKTDKVSAALSYFK